MMVFGDGKIATVKEGMQVFPEEQTVADFMRAVFVIRFDMGGIEDRQGFFAGDGATAFVSFHDQDPESALAEPGAGEVLVAVTFPDTYRGGFGLCADIHFRLWV